MATYRIPELKLPLDHGDADIRKRISRELGVAADRIESFSIDRKSFDARDRDAIKVVYGLHATVKEEATAGRAAETARAEGPEPEPYAFPEPRMELASRPVVVGAGPAGLFCALSLAEMGYKPLLLERGDPVDARMEAVAGFWASGRLDPESNIQFGEGGAGTFSDGKLNTTVNDRSGRNGKVIAEFIEAGAPAEIGYINKPHIGTDYLVTVVKNLRRKIEALGGEVRFRSRVDSLVIEGGKVAGVVVGTSGTGGTAGADGAVIAATKVVLAVGHGARDVFESLAKAGVPMERKAFAIGVRIEHPQEMIQRNQFGKSWRHPALPVADYKLTWRATDGRGVYSFCMCPGGQVVNASSEEGGVACNGMSYFARDGRNANSAIVVQVGPEDFGPEGGVLAGVEFQRRWERLAFKAGGGDYSLPVQGFADFAAGRASTASSGLRPDIKGLWRSGDIRPALPGFVSADIIEGVKAFDRRIAGFAGPEATLTGVETRTSSPLRILRGEGCESPIAGLYPCGEGAGYSGGIMSSAMDGIRVAEAIARG